MQHPRAASAEAEDVVAPEVVIDNFVDEDGNCRSGIVFLWPQPRERWQQKGVVMHFCLTEKCSCTPIFVPGLLCPQVW